MASATPTRHYQPPLPLCMSIPLDPWSVTWARYEAQFTRELPHEWLDYLRNPFNARGARTMSEFFGMCRAQFTSPMTARETVRNFLTILEFAIDGYSCLIEFKRTTSTYWGPNFNYASPGYLFSNVVSATAASNVIVNVVQPTALAAPTPQAALAVRPSGDSNTDDGMDDDMQRDEKDLKALLRTYKGVVIKVENAHFERIREGKSIETRVLFVADDKVASARADKFFATAAEKAGGEDKAGLGYLSGTAKLWHAEIPKKVHSRGQALGANEDEDVM